MLTKEELEQLDNVRLFSLLLQTQEEIIQFWRNIPSHKFPDEKQAIELSSKEEYARTIEGVLAARGRLPKSWGKQ